MTYGVEETPKGYELSVEAADREGLFREALAAAASVASPAHPADSFEGGVPLQAAGDTDEELLSGIVTELLQAAAETKGGLGAPRWLLFEPGRVTANLPLAPGAAKGRRLALRASHVTPGKATLTLARLNGR